MMEEFWAALVILFAFAFALAEMLRLAGATVSSYYAASRT